MPPVKNTEASAVTDAELEEATRPSSQSTQNGTSEPQKVKLAERITAFAGEHLLKVPRTITVDDPSRSGAKLTHRKTLEGYSNFVCQYVVGNGKMSNTGEAYVTILGQYGPAQTARITASAQNYDLVLNGLLKGNVDMSGGKGINDSIRWPLIQEKVVSVFGRPMLRQQRDTRGLAIDELYLRNADGTWKAIIGSVQEQNQDSAQPKVDQMSEAFI